MKIAGIYLAAGQSSRMGAFKVSRELSPGLPLGSIALMQLEACGLAEVIVVVREDDKLNWLPPKPGHAGCQRRILSCADAAKGMSYSLRCGLHAAMESEADAICVMLADQPFVTAAHISRLITIFQQLPFLDYVASSNGQSPLPPVLFAKSMFPLLQRLRGDKGANALLQLPGIHGAVIRGSNPLFSLDADTEEDFKYLQEQWGHQQNVDSLFRTSAINSTNSFSFA